MTNLEITNAYVGDTQIAKIYLGTDVVWVYEEPEPEPCAEYEEGTQEKCECEGRYWWGDECHDEEQPIAHTASVLLDGSVDVDLPETTVDMYDMLFTEPYTSLTLYYDDEVVTASTLFVSVDGTTVADETDFEVTDINTDTYGGSSINSISFNADSNDVYIDFAP